VLRVTMFAYPRTFAFPDKNKFDVEMPPEAKTFPATSKFDRAFASVEMAMPVPVILIISDEVAAVENIDAPLNILPPEDPNAAYKPFVPKVVPISS
jgi:hypothetical protein